MINIKTKCTQSIYKNQTEHKAKLTNAFKPNSICLFYFAVYF